MKSIEPPACRCPDDDGCGHVEPFPLPERAPLVAPATAKHMRIESDERDAPARAAYGVFFERVMSTINDSTPWEELEHEPREVWRAIAHAAISSAFGRLADGR